MAWGTTIIWSLYMCVWVVFLYSLSGPKFFFGEWEWLLFMLFYFSFSIHFLRAFLHVKIDFCKLFSGFYLEKMELEDIKSDLLALRQLYGLLQTNGDGMQNMALENVTILTNFINSFMLSIFMQRCP